MLLTSIKYYIMIVGTTQKVLRVLPFSRSFLKQSFSTLKRVQPFGLTRIAYHFADVQKQNTQKMEFKT